MGHCLAIKLLTVEKQRWFHRIIAEISFQLRSTPAEYRGRCRHNNWTLWPVFRLSVNFSRLEHKKKRDHTKQIIEECPSPAAANVGRPGFDLGLLSWPFSSPSTSNLNIPLSSNRHRRKTETMTIHPTPFKHWIACFGSTASMRITAELRHNTKQNRK